MNAPAPLDPRSGSRNGRSGRGSGSGAHHRGAARRPVLRRVLAGAGLGLAALALAACGSSSASTTTTSTKSSGAARGFGAGGSGAGQRQFPGASGTIASINGSTLEVQGTSSQTSVTYTSTTTFSQTVAGTTANVTVGSCISAFGKPTSSTSTSKGATFDQPITATTVSISQPQSGTCARGVGGFGGFAGRAGASGAAGTGGGAFSGGGRGPEGGTGSGAQARRPPAGGESRFRGQFGAASGTVTAVAGTKVTVSETDPQSKKTTSVVVTLGSSATYSVQQSASAADLAVGHCATALGTASSTGAITARSITLSTPGADGCTARFAGPGGAPSGARPVPSRSAAAETLATGDGPLSSASVPPTAPDPLPRRHLFRRAVTPFRLVVVGILVVAGVVAWTLTGGAAPAYRAATVTTGTVQSTIDGVGTVTPVDQADLGFQTSGTVAAVDVTVGQKVTAGQTLASLDTTALETAVVSDQASLAKAEAKLASDEASQTSSSSSSSPSGGTGATGNGTGTGNRSGTGTGSSGTPGATGTGSAQAIAAIQKLQAQLVSDQQQLDQDSATAQAAVDRGHHRLWIGVRVGTDHDYHLDHPALNCAGALAVASSDQQKVSADVRQVNQAERALNAAISSLTGGGTAPDSGTGTAPTGGGTGARLTAEVTTLASDSDTAGGSGTSGGQYDGSSGSGTSGQAVTSEQLVVNQADIDVAAADLTGAQQSLAEANLVSPIAGTVGSLGIATGDSVESGSSDAVVVVGSGNTYRVVTDVNVAQLHLVAAGDPALVTPDATNAVLHGTVSAIGAVADSSSTGSTTYPVTVTLTASDLGGLSGAQAEVNIVDHTISHVTTVPSSAVTTIGSQHFVTVLEGSVVTRTPVTVGTVGDVRTQIVNGVHSGEQVSLADLNAAVPSTSTDTNTFGSGFGGEAGFGGAHFNGGAGSTTKVAGPVGGFEG